MTDNNHPITPPPELVRQWARYQGFESPEVLWRQIATQAARWGADQELEACCEWLEDADLDDSQKVSWVNLRAARRPKPPSLKEQALAALDDAVMRGDCITISDALPTIRRALEQLDD